MQINQSPILVTGASGYVASHIIHQLLVNGHTVHGTVRDKSNIQKVDHLIKMNETLPGTLVLFNADLLSEGSFKEAMNGCELIMHTASPFFVEKIKNAQTQLIDPALKGTLNVLKSASDTSSVKRIVLTSSIAAIYGDNADMEKLNLKEFTEEHWNSTSSISYNPYSYSKTVAEKAAWEFSEKQSQWDLVVINPGFILGPSHTKRTDSTSINSMLRMGNGDFKMGVPDFDFAVVDVRDVAKAHILAGLTSTASGRHITIADHKTFLELGQLLNKNMGGSYPFPKKNLPYFLVWLFGPLQGFSRKYIKNNWGYKLNFNNNYVQKDLGLTFRPISETVVDHFNQLLDDKLLKKRT